MSTNLSQLGHSQNQSQSQSAQAMQDLLPAWQDTVQDAQLVFRSLLTALSEPGSIQRLKVELTAPAPLHMATAAACLALMDFETTAWLADELDTDAVRTYLRFHCGLPLVAEAAQANFAVLSTPLAELDLNSYAQGSMGYPDKSATLLIQVDDLENGPHYWLSGPGIKDTAAFRVSGLPDDFADKWQQNFLAFPLGVDVIFCCGNQVLGLPRTSRMSLEQETGESPCTSL